MEIIKSINNNSEKIILHLCCNENNPTDSIEYINQGYDVRLVGKSIGVENYDPPENVYGIIANPPCTMFSIARLNPNFGLRDLREGMFLVNHCLRIIWECQYDVKSNGQSISNLKFWCIENPGSGLLKWFLGKPAFTYQPFEYGENFTKLTALWGMFNEPIKPLLFNPISSKRSKATNLNYGFSDKQKAKRSECPYSFAKAFFEANQ
ncbi:MAG: hypothetical protein PHQ91_15930 [Thermoanaerobaculaceae bacterium]|nr:hypothetical protein [Thermoanaerobaculaceae bacterium]